MKKNIIIIFASVFFISACGIETKTEYATKADRPVRTDTEETYEILNHNLLGKDFLKYIGEDLLVRGVCDYSEGVKGDFVPVIKEKSIFPEDLVVMLEEAFYHSSNVMSRGNESAYMEKLNAWGAEEFMLEMDDLYLHFPEIAVYKEQIQWEEEAYDLICDIYGGPVKCLRCFYIPSTNGDQYAFLYQSGGSNGALSVCLTELIDNQLVWVNEFEVQNDGDGRVVLYEGEFYYVFLELNYNLKEYDGIRIHKLGDNPEAENLLIRYLPERYIWEKCYFDAAYRFYEETEDSLDEYVEKIKEEIMSDSYLDVGTSRNGIEVYYGDEEETEDIVLEPYDTVYKMDIANCNTPVYLCKTEYVPSNIGTSEYLKIRFYLYDFRTDSVVELDQLSEEEGSYSIDLVQMWFKEIDEKIYTFRIYHICDYNYMMNIVILNGDKADPVGTYVLLPQRGFVLTEGEVFTTCG